VTKVRSQGRNYFRRPSLAAVKALLAEAQLPTSDLAAAQLEHFIGCGTDDALDGVVGVELYPPVALLRSLCVTASKRDHDVGSALLVEAEHYGRSRGVSEIYLLTTTAEQFFARKGYERVARETAPAAIRATQEFSALCPASAAFMRKRLV